MVESATRAQDAAGALARVVDRSAAPAQREWFAAALATARDPHQPADFLAAYAGAARRLRAVPVVLAAAELATLEDAGLRGLGSWTLDRVARAALLCASAAAGGDPSGVVESVYRTGDNDERVALLGALAALAGAERVVRTAIDACRTNVTSVFEAIACENPYPAAYFPEDAFNQMVLKALFLGVAVSRIEGLDGRRNDELVRMVTAYASERRAAGRSVPQDVDVILSPEAHAS